METKPAAKEVAILQTKQLAAILGCKPVTLRRVLRSMPVYADGVFTRYRWNGESDPMIPKIKARMGEIAKERAERKVKAEADLKAKTAEREAAAKADKTAEKAPAKKVA